MAPANPTTHAKTAADALDRLVRDVKSGRAQWGHPQHVRQGTDDLTRAAEAMATTLQEMTAALARLQPPGPRVQQTTSALHLAGQAVTDAVVQMRQARRTMN